jgi:hypothetical protein
LAMPVASAKKNKTSACNRANPQHFCMHRERPSIGGKFEKISKITRSAHSRPRQQLIFENKRVV